MPVLCLSVMTNMAAGVLEQPLTSEEVLETATAVAKRFSVYLKKIIERIGEVAL
jgi:purine-nucleoside phosphorylase